MSRSRAVAALTPGALLVFMMFTGAARAQGPTPPPPTQTPAPPPAPTTPSTQVAGRLLTLEECIAIALEAQPKIQATLADYAAARYRVNQALSPLLPQLSGLVSTTRSNIPTVTTTGVATNLTTVQPRQFGDTFIAQVQPSHLLFAVG